MSYKRLDIRKITMIGMLSAISFILMYMQFSISFVPEYIKMDISDLPALVGSFSLGPVSGVFICLIKNLLHLMVTKSGGIGELSNLILGICFVVPAGFIYKKKKNRKWAFIGAVIGAVAMAAASILSNYFIVYPFYSMLMPMETIIKSYQILYPKIDNLWEALIFINMPFTFVKGMLSVGITFLIYKHISPVIKGQH
ncbi:ECF transporter S component [Anaerosacchariphilus polymeriproducens]|uniref:Riboflavin transporter n=1 Tax=Anaerosacchariphilus polymeriproducens TaxID=1812858 RepID=A0A371AVJ0_9FIRM|nr:ECF transporter S component [Anaerosacchariphilus polymeriproducens]RDU23598.1 ECF transporter S component [Anaerosacchariphilus polymeriproducens]